MPGCTEPAKARRWCNVHYSRSWRTGDPLPSARPRPTVEEVYAERVAAYRAALIAHPVAADLRQGRSYGRPRWQPVTTAQPVLKAGWIRRLEAPGGGVARRRSAVRAPPTPAVPD